MAAPRYLWNKGEILDFVYNGTNFVAIDQTYASVTYFRLQEGSQVAVIIPANNENATWAAVEAAI